MDCKKMEEIILTDYIDGKLEGAVLKEAEGHIASCAGCRGLVREFKAVAASLHNAPREEPPDLVWEKIRAAITASERAPARTFFTRARPAFAFAALAAAILAIFIAVRPTFLKEVSPVREQYDVLSLSVSDTNGNDSEYDMGTPAEEYFL